MFLLLASFLIVSSTIIIAIFIGHYARRNGRNGWGWGILAYVSGAVVTAAPDLHDSNIGMFYVVYILGELLILWILSIAGQKQLSK